MGDLSMDFLFTFSFALPLSDDSIRANNPPQQPNQPPIVTMSTAAPVTAFWRIAGMSYLQVCLYVVS